MPSPKDPQKFAEYCERQRRIALERGYGKWMAGKSPNAETRAKISAAQRALCDDGERARRSERAKQAGSGTWMEGRSALPQTRAGLARGRELSYEERYGDRAEEERAKRRETNRRRWDGVPRSPHARDKHNGDWQYAEWRQAVFLRDKFTCRRCEGVGGKLNAHHIKRWATHPELRYRVDNGLTLCESCHREVHRREG